MDQVNTFDFVSHNRILISDWLKLSDLSLVPRVHHVPPASRGKEWQQEDISCCQETVG